MQFANPVASRFGARVGDPIDEVIHIEDRRFFSREMHFGETSVGVPSHRFAVRLHNSDSISFVRSAIAGCPIPAIASGEDDHLVVILPVNETDANRIKWLGADEEQKNLSHLLAHGILKQSVLLSKHPKATPSVKNLAGLLQHRIQVITHLLSNWDSEQRAIRTERSGGRATPYAVRKSDLYTHLETLNWFGTYVAANPALRSETGLGNGVLSGTETATAPMEIDLDEWSEVDVGMSLVQNGYMFIFEELVINAFKFGKKGTDVRVKVRREGAALVARVMNDVDSVPRADIPRKYAGTAIVRNACEQCGWELQAGFKTEAREVEDADWRKAATEVEMQIHEATLTIPLLR